MGAQGAPAAGAVARLDNAFSKSVAAGEMAVRDAGAIWMRYSSSTSGDFDVEVIQTSGVRICGGGIFSATTESEAATMANGMARAWVPNMVVRLAPASRNGMRTRPLVWAAELALKVQAPLGQVYM